jgi:hypothetical protein
MRPPRITPGSVGFTLENGLFRIAKSLQYVLGDLLGMSRSLLNAPERRLL